MADACGVNASRPRAALSPSALHPDLSFGDQHDAQHTNHQDGALQEQRGRVDGDCAQHGGAAEGSVQVARQHYHGHQGGGQTAECEDELSGVSALSRQERLDEDAGDGGPENDQHRGQQSVFDGGCWEVHRAGPSATLGAGSG